VIKALVPLFLYLPFMLFAHFNWEGSQEGFFGKIDFSSQEIFLDDILEIDLKLTYPKSYHLEADLLKVNLLRNNSFGSPPFFLLDEKVTTNSEDEKMTQTIHYRLDPQLAGTHPITFLNIVFRSKEHSKEAFTPVFQVKVLLPERSPDFQEEMAPLLTFSERLPIEINGQNKKKLESLSGLIQENTFLIYSRSLFILFGGILLFFAGCYLLYRKKI
jgi:hypothetical protein